jgi:hypothetical protein
MHGTRARAPVLENRAAQQAIVHNIGAYEQPIAQRVER